VGTHGAGALFRVVGLQQQTPLIRPETVEGADDVLEVHMTDLDEKNLVMSVVSPGSKIFDKSFRGRHPSTGEINQS